MLLFRGRSGAPKAEMPSRGTPRALSLRSSEIHYLSWPLNPCHGYPHHSLTMPLMARRRNEVVRSTGPNRCPRALFGGESAQVINLVAHPAMLPLESVGLLVQSRSMASRPSLPRCAHRAARKRRPCHVLQLVHSADRPEPYLQRDVQRL